MRFLSLPISSCERKKSVHGFAGWRPLAAGLTVLLLCGELTGSAVQMLRGLDGEFGFQDREDYAAFRRRGAALLGALDTVAEEEGFYRVENATARNSNDGMSVGYHAVSHYSSLSINGPSGCWESWE